MSERSAWGPKMMPKFLMIAMAVHAYRITAMLAALPRSQGSWSGSSALSGSWAWIDAWRSNLQCRRQMSCRWALVIGKGLCCSFSPDRPKSRQGNFRSETKAGTCRGRILPSRYWKSMALREFVICQE
ncbi:hypothetical protein BJX70DRAFT_171685 [Aspergillus crustosus]